MSNYCSGCPIKGAPCATGVGNKQSKIAIVGRNPGRTEAVTGIPFTGASGQLLDATLQELGMKRDELYVTNAVNCFVEGEGAEPSREMYETCRPRLMQELKQVNPSVILTLGNEATKSLLGWGIGNIMSLIGSMHHVDELNCWAVPTFHPAYILRGNLGGFDDLKDALDRANRLATGITPFPAPLPYEHVYYAKTEKECFESLLKLTREGPYTLAIDTETNTVRDPNKELLLLQFGDGKDAWVFEAEHIIKHGSRNWCLLVDLFKDSERKWIFHNAEFDLQLLQYHWGIMPKNIEDTMMLALCLDEKLQHSGLKRLVNQYLSVPHYEQALQKYITHKNVGYSVIPREVLVPYAGFDVIFTYRLFPVLMEKVRKEGNERLYPLLVEVQRLFAKMAFGGVKVDLNYVRELQDEFYPLRDQLEKEMQAYAWGMGYRATEVVANARDWPFLNVRSPKQLLYFVTKYCKLNTKSTDKHFMEAYEGHEFIDMLSRFRTVDHMITAFVDGIENEVWPDGRVHPDFLHGTVTGRTTIEHPALQTIMRDNTVERYKVKPIRKLFIVEPGYKFVHADYSQLEMRVAWHISQDEALGRAVMSKDMHTTMAASIFNIPIEEVDGFQRVVAKTVTFGMMYGRQAPSIARLIKTSVEEAQVLLDSYETQFPKYYKWWKKQQDVAIETGFLEAPFGRRRRWGLITPDTENEIRRQAANFTIQSTATDICIRSLIQIEEELEARQWGRALFAVHDSVELEVKEEMVDETIKLMLEIMEHPFEQTCAVFTVKYGVGDNWSEASD